VCVYIKNSFVLEDLYKQNIFAVSCYVMLWVTENKDYSEGS
jgi:hypothetical protein